MSEAIQYIEVNGVNHPIDAVSVNGKTLDDLTTIPFTNPVGPWCPDPCFWKGDDGYFYIKGTGRLNTVVRTRNFVNFEDTGRVFISTGAQNEVFETYGHYATDDNTYKLHPNYWAPFVIKIGSNWVMYMAVVERTGTKSEPVDGAAHIVAFTSKTPYGDFENPVTIVSDGDFKITNSVVWNNVIDPFVYYDSKVNKLYLVAGSSYSIGCVELTGDGLSTVLTKGVGNKATRLGGLTINSDPNRWAVYEGTYVYARPYNGQTYYYLFASMGDWSTRDYAVVVGRSLNSDNGSYVDKSGINLITGNKSISLTRRILFTESDTSTFWGPGHIGGIFETEDGKTWMLYHCHDGSGEQDRKLFIQELLWDENGWPYFENNGHPISTGRISKHIITSTNAVECKKDTNDINDIKEFLKPILIDYVQIQSQPDTDMGIAYVANPELYSATKIQDKLMAGGRVIAQIEDITLPTWQYYIANVNYYDDTTIVLDGRVYTLTNSKNGD